MMNDIEAAADVAALLADPLRLRILHFLTWAPASVAELVELTGSSQPNVSNHLRLLRGRDMVAGERRGRRMVYRIASPAVAELFNALSWAALGKAHPTSVPATGALIEARTCYDHLAGRLGVALMRRLIEVGAILEPRDAWSEIEAGPAIEGVFRRLGLDLCPSSKDASRRRYAFACPDWSESGHAHVGGVLGAALCRRCLEAGWIERDNVTRAVRLTPSGVGSLAWLLDGDD